jgi:hypothetical protein
MAATTSKAAGAQKRPQAEREFTTPMQLTSPVEKSDRVKDAYWLLSGHNVFKQDFHPGKNDGKYGPAAASAAKRAKEMLGYPDNGIDNVFGQQLFDYLLGKVELPPAYAKRRQARLAALDPAKTAKNKAVDAALKDFEDHVTETPVNMTPFGKWYGMDGVFWCCIYVTYRLVNAGFDGFERGKFASYCGHVVDAAKRHERGLAITTDPERGDIVIYNNDEHIEFFVEWVSPNRTFRAVGGNTSGQAGSRSNGGEVAENVRSIADPGFPVSYFVRVGA